MAWIPGLSPGVWSRFGLVIFTSVWFLVERPCLIATAGRLTWLVRLRRTPSVLNGEYADAPSSHGAQPRLIEPHLPVGTKRVFYYCRKAHAIGRVAK